MAQYDCIIIGGGHNGLITAAYLARARRKVCVLERRHVLGGCCSTEELWPGFRLSPAADLLNFVQPPIVRELKLCKYGLKFIRRDPACFTPLPDGRCLLLGSDEKQNRQQIGQFSVADAEAFPEYRAFLTRLAETLEPLLMGPPLRIPPRVRDFNRVWQMFRTVSKLSKDFRRTVELLGLPAARFLSRWFESDVVKTTLAADTIIGQMISPQSPGSAAVLLPQALGDASGKRGTWVYVRGGMGGLADALEKVCRGLGVEIRREAEVAAVNFDGRQATGVTLTDGSEIRAAAVASSVDARHTLFKLLGRKHLSEDFARQIARLDYASPVAKINLALSGLPDFGTGELDRAATLRGTTYIAPSLEYIERAFDDAKYGNPSRRPVMRCTIPSTVDDSLCPAGKHVMGIFVQYAPYDLAEGNWDGQKEAFADRCLDVLAEFAPRLKDLVLQRQVLSPLDLERTYGLTGGNILQGAMGIDQLGPMRSDCRTPIPGLFLCGAAIHPGGGVHGACALIASREILKG